MRPRSNVCSLVYSLFLTIAVVSAGCDSETEDKNCPIDAKTSVSEILYGEWQMITPLGTFFETWRGLEAKEIIGISVLMYGRDTIWRQVYRWSDIDSLLVVSFEDGRTLLYACSSPISTVLEFKAVTNDYPQRIVYRKTGDATLEKSLVGAFYETYSTESFRFVKISD